MTPDERSALSPNDPEYALRWAQPAITGSKHGTKCDIQNPWLQDTACRLVDLWHAFVVSQRLAACILHAAHGTAAHQLLNCHISDRFLQAGLGRDYEIRIYVGYAIVIVSYIVVIFNLFFGCHPFHKYYQISPDPGSMWPPIETLVIRLQSLTECRCLSTCCFEPDRVGVLRIQCRHGHVSAVDTATNALAV